MQKRFRVWVLGLIGVTRTERDKAFCKGCYCRNEGFGSQSSVTLEDSFFVARCVADCLGGRRGRIPNPNLQS